MEDSILSGDVESFLEKTTTPQYECSSTNMVEGFRWPDYLVFLLTLLISVAIGIYYGFFGGGQMTSAEYLMGNREMDYIPMSLSLSSGFLSAITMLANPAEMYNYGSQYWVASFGFFLVVPATSYLFLPVFVRLRVTSAYEYLNRRFNKNVGYSMSFLFIIQMLMYSTCIVYAPALALSLVTGITVYITIAVLYVVCIFYTSVGGIKAVIWSDTVQTFVVLITTLVIIVRGSQMADDVWSPNFETGRIEFFNLDPSITARHTFWSVFIGGTIFWIGMYSTNQASVQRLLTVPTLSDARRGLWLTATVLAIIYTMLFVLGMLIYSKYRHCDPVSSEAIEAIDQILPLYVMDIMGDIPGAPGLFAAGIFSASLSSVAAALNAMSAVAMKDFWEGLLGKRQSEFQEAFISKVFCSIIGAFSFGLVFFVEQLGGILQTTISFNGMMSGVMMGVFFLGMYFPWTNNKGAISGAIAGLSLTAWMCLGAQLSTASGHLVFPRKPISIENCSCNATLYDPSSESQIFPLYRVSYLWYSAFGALTTVVVGFIVSHVTGAQDPRLVDAALVADLTKFVANKLSKRWRDILNLPYYGEMAEGDPMSTTTCSMATISAIETTQAEYEE